MASKKKILLIDDSDHMRRVIRLVLQQADYDTLEARDGAQGLDVIAANADLSLVICDLNMPVMGGLELLKEAVRANVTVPILMLTTEASPELMAEAHEAGARAWMVKPFNPQRLVSAVDQLTGA